ncbi:protein of unknown function [Cupriavidus taiwanensis]|uniref:Uncharacterized protein n=1 Tax=Cupriavidus taiwanensis TaxID=164546 RepID=A0A375ID33_9BURK|nr:hypothetical protein CBM2592_A110055 [Cupriavidus taiwanensis]SOY58859.1 hypothetical protein CBM2588_A80057 [Cupriavidus taiwanensis]SOY80093.1 hypothetical protein CBM2591_A120056 [Cupriavidus taiwanensis]SOZ26642.1 hypothetical protein CBM2608_A90054 [Cupriavidus taiwanensis]SOZ50859.1 hypothetical protein CBM2617_A110055 [Cupriavidus taiwanensis]
MSRTRAAPPVAALLRSVWDEARQCVLTVLVGGYRHDGFAARKQWGELPRISGGTGFW